MIYHATFTIAVPILVTDLIFPARRHLPYLRTRGLVITAVVYVVGVLLLRLAVAPNAPGADPGEPVPVGHLAVAAGVVVALGIVALKVLPRTSQRPTRAGAPPAPWAVGIVVAAATVLALRLPAPLGAATSDPHPLLGRGWPVLVLLVASLATVAVVLALLRRWSTQQGWGRDHHIGVAGGALLAHTAVGAALFAQGNRPELITLAVFMMLEVALVIALHRRGRTNQEEPTQ